MKNIFLFLALIMSMVSFAQTKKKDVTTNRRSITTQKSTVPSGPKVLGIGIYTTRTKYEKELSKKGYTKPSKYGNHDEYIVEFAGHQNCKFDIYYNLDSDLITEIRIIFPYNTYRQCSDVEYEIVKQLNAKYGKSERKDNLYKTVRSLGEDHRGEVLYTWSNEVAIVAIRPWNSISDKIGENSFTLIYYTGVPKSSERITHDDL